MAASTPDVAQIADGVPRAKHRIYLRSIDIVQYCTHFFGLQAPGRGTPLRIDSMCDSRVALKRVLRSRINRPCAMDTTLLYLEHSPS
jgi:hypothetical protein